MLTAPAHRPIEGASAVVLRRAPDGALAVLLVERGRPPFVGLWSLPGGKIEPGETAEQAAVREVAEETGLAATLIGRLGVHAAEGLAGTRVHIAVHLATVDHGEPIAGDDAAAAAFVPLAELARLPLTDGAADLILAGARQFDENSLSKQATGARQWWT